MKSKILIIAMSIAVIATVFMGCSKDNNNNNTTSSTTGTSAVTDTTNNASTTGNNGTSNNNGTSDTTNDLESRADKVGDDIRQWCERCS